MNQFSLQPESLSTDTEKIGDLYYFGDPMCSWCWGIQPVLEQLDQEYPELERKMVMGGLRQEIDPGPMSALQAYRIQNAWRQIEEVTQQTFNYDFWKQGYPSASTRNACLAVVAARLIDSDYEWSFMVEMFKTYYLYATDPSIPANQIEVAKKLNIDTKQYQDMLVSDLCRETLEQDFEITRQFGINSFPSLVLVIKEKGYQVSIGYQSIQHMRRAINAIFEHASITQHTRPENGLYV